MEHKPKTAAPPSPLWRHLLEWFHSGLPLSAHYGAYSGGRSSKWPALEARLIKQHPYCAATGTVSGLVGHHVVPFSIDPSLELDERNIIILSDSNNSHLILGHLGCYRRYNIHVRKDATTMLGDIHNFIREHGDG